MKFEYIQRVLKDTQHWLRRKLVSNENFRGNLNEGMEGIICKLLKRINFIFVLVTHCQTSFWQASDDVLQVSVGQFS